MKAQGFAPRRAYVFILLALCFSQLHAVDRRYTEDFTTTLYKDDPATTAFWDVASGQLKLHPFELTLAGNCDTPGEANSVVVSGDYAYVADGSSGIQVIDISDPTDPTSAGTFDTIEMAFDLVINDEKVYLVDSSNGLQIIDISDPKSPSLITSFETPGSAHCVAISGDHVYIADWTSDVQVIKVFERRVNFHANVGQSLSYSINNDIPQANVIRRTFKPSSCGLAT